MSPVTMLKTAVEIVIPIDPRLIEQFTDWGVRLEKRVPPEGDKQSCRHSMTGPVE